MQPAMKAAAMRKAMVSGERITIFTPFGLSEVEARTRAKRRPFACGSVVPFDFAQGERLSERKTSEPGHSLNLWFAACSGAADLKSASEMLQ
jgi:hypothetical protein